MSTEQNTRPVMKKYLLWLNCPSYTISVALGLNKPKLFDDQASAQAAMQKSTEKYCELTGTPAADVVVLNMLAYLSGNDAFRWVITEMEIPYPELYALVKVYEGQDDEPLLFVNYDDAYAAMKEAFENSLAENDYEWAEKDGIYEFNLSEGEDEVPSIQPFSAQVPVPNHWTNWSITKVIPM